MDQRFRGFADWLFESVETASAHLMKKATLRSLFALGPTFNKNAYKDKWHWLAPGTARTGVAQASPHSGVSSAPRLCFVSHGQVLRCALPSEVSSVWGFQQPNVKGQASKPAPSFPSWWEECAGAAQSLHTPNIAALPQAKGPRTSTPVLQNEDGDWSHVARPGSHPHPLPTSLRQELEGLFFFYFFPFFPP